MSSLALLGRGEARGFAADRRFCFGLDATHRTAEPQLDRVAQAFEQGRTEGFSEAMALAEAQAAEAEAARQAIEHSFSRLDEACAADLREKLRETVLALCEAAVTPLAIDPEGLCRRIQQAVAMLQHQQDARLVRLHPDDLVLVEARLPAGVAVEADPSLERGSLQIDTPDGGIEDGPRQWRAILAEAFGQC